MKLRGEIRRVDVPRSEIRTYANEEGLDALAGLTGIVCRRMVEVNGVPITRLIAERMGMDEPDSVAAQSHVLRLLLDLNRVLPSATTLDYIRHGSYILEDDAAAQADVSAVENGGLAGS